MSVTSSNVAVYSEDGINWTTIKIPFNSLKHNGWSNVCFYNNTFFVYSYDIYKYSYDCINWVGKNVHDPILLKLNYLDIINEKNNFFLTGYLVENNIDVLNSIPKSSLLRNDVKYYVFILVSEINSTNGENIFCDTQYLQDNDNIILIDDVSNKILKVKDKTNNSLKLEKNSEYIFPSKGKIFVEISEEILKPTYT